MRMAFLLILALMIVGLLSCSSKRQREKVLERERQYQEELSQRQTHQQGVLAAGKYARENGFRIFRYDVPIVRTGYWPHETLYKHFGIQSWWDSAGTLSYFKGYNAEMDRLLLKKYGSEYQKYRSQMIPAADAKPDPVWEMLWTP